jgi:hypothetical protein
MRRVAQSETAFTSEDRPVRVEVRPLLRRKLWMEA